MRNQVCDTKKAQRIWKSTIVRKLTLQRQQRDLELNIQKMRPPWVPIALTQVSKWHARCGCLYLNVTALHITLARVPSRLAQVRVSRRIQSLTARR